MTMISGKDVYAVVKAIAPLYFAMLLAFGSVRWWKIFTPEQCSGINTFVMLFTFPFLAFNFISSNNPYKMNLRFIAADTLQKVFILLLLFLFRKIFAKKKYGSTTSLSWTITLFSLSSIPNTLVMGIPILKAMYGDFSGDLMVQVVLLQSVVWSPLMLIMFEYRAAKIFISQQFPNTARSINSVEIDSDVVSIVDSEPLKAKTEISDDGKLQVVIRRQCSSREGSTTSTTMSGTVGMVMSEISKGSVGEQLCSTNKERHKFARTNSADSQGNVVSKDLFGSKGDSPDDQSGVVPGVDLELNKVGPEKQQQMPPANVLIRLIFVIVSRKLIRNPNSYASILALIWSLVAFRWNVKLPKIVNDCIEILSNCGLGMAMFSLGLFMSLQPKLIPCGKRVAAFAMGVRFLIGPAVMAAVSAAIGIHGVLLQIAIVQAALPQGIGPFVFSKQYDVHPDIFSTALIFGMVLALPITIIYYILLGL